jgi:CHAD domain-containing protein
MTDPEVAAVVPIEIELKYRMTDAATGERLIGSDDLAGFSALSPVETVSNVDRYLDTPGAALATAGYAGRLRTTDTGTVITLKGLQRHDGGGATHRREELEGPADRATGAATWPESAARDAVLAIAGDTALVDLVTIRQLRRKRLYGKDTTVVELSVDDVEVVSGDIVIERFAELEVELREGDETALESLADLLAEVEELLPAETSKLERALEAVSREPAPPEEDEGEDGNGGAKSPEVAPVVGAEIPPAAAAPATSPAEDAPAKTSRSSRSVTMTDPAETTGASETAEASEAEQASAVAEMAATTVDAAPTAEPPAAEPAEPRIIVPKSPGVLADDHLAEAGRKVLRFHLARMVTREAGTREGKDSEELHAMRVATRRQRAAWRVFGDAFDPGRTKRHRGRLKLVAADLGAVRDLDVLIAAGEAYQARLAVAEAKWFEPLLATWRARREAARLVLLKELDSERHRRWVDDYVAFLQVEGLGALAVGPTQPHRVRDTMPSRVWAAYENVRAYEAVMRWADVTTLHDLRIAAKWLRYTLEFVREALGRDAGPVIEKVVALQDHLGWLHDAEVAAGLARQFLVEHASQLSEQESAAIGRYLVDRERELARLRRTVGPPWRGVSSLAFRRAMGRLVAGL